MNFIRKHWFKLAMISIAAIVLVMAYPLAVRAFTKRAPTEATDASGKPKLVLRVIDGFTANPIEGAIVIEPRSGRAFETDAGGRTKTFSPETTANDCVSRFSFNTADVLVNAEGYVNLWVTGIMVYNSSSTEFTIELFRTEDVPDTELISVAEAPPDEWIEAVKAIGDQAIGR